MVDPSQMLPFPPTPQDVVENILFYSLYEGSEFSAFIQDDDRTGHPVDFRQRQAQFARSFLLINRDFYRMATKLLWMSVFITSTRDLAHFTDMVASGPAFADLKLGDLCNRLEIRLACEYDRDLLNNLLQQMPQLEVFVFRTYWNVLGSPTRVHIGDTISVLSTHTPHLRRIQFESGKEDPTASMLKDILASLPLLVTLHTDRVPATVSDNDDRPFSSVAPSLRVLSVGNYDRWAAANPSYWQLGDILRCFTNQSALPLLDTVYLQCPPDSTRSFLTIFGAQINELGVCAADVIQITGVALQQHYFAYCPRLTNIVCTVVGDSITGMFDGLAQMHSVDSGTVVYYHRAHEGERDGLPVFREVVDGMGPPTFPAQRLLRIVTPPRFTPALRTDWFKRIRRTKDWEFVTVEAIIGGYS